MSCIRAGETTTSPAPPTEPIPHPSPARRARGGGGGNEQELGRHLQIKAFHSIQLRQEGVDYPTDGHFVKVDLLRGDQVEQQIEGPFEDRCTDLIGHEPRLPSPWSPHGACSIHPPLAGYTELKRACCGNRTRHHHDARVH